MLDFILTYQRITLQFKRPSGTSRGVLTEKHSWILELSHPSNPDIKGIGECSVIAGLSPDFENIESYEEKLDQVAKNIGEDLNNWPSIKFGLESAILDLDNGGKQVYFDNDFQRGKSIPINGLIWMGDEKFMQEQINQKIKEGFETIKMKIGAIDWEKELSLLKGIRNHFPADKITLRVDANGAFSPDNALEKLEELSKLDIHSIEQPIRQGQIAEMRELCSKTPVPIALDEELIGVESRDRKIELLDSIQAQYIILKPSLHGGISGTKEWIELAEERSIAWWMTSALEANVGLNTICQLAAEYKNDLPQGLGTGSLFVNNTEERLVVDRGHIRLKEASQH